MSVNVVVTATLIVYIGSHRSLRLLATEEEGGVANADKEVMSTKDAAQFPLVGSCALFGLFLAFKYLDKTTVNLVLGLYFGFVGIFSMTGTIAPFLTTWITSTKTYGFKTRELPLVGEIDLQLTPAELVAMVPATIFSYLYFKTKHFMLNNLFGISFCVQSIERISIGSYKIGVILLSGLFIYDIFWVFGSESIFGSNVMVTVAKSFDGPIKLLFAKTLPGGDIGQALSSAITNVSNTTMLQSVEYTNECGKHLNSISGMLRTNDGYNSTTEFAQHMINFSTTTDVAVDLFKADANCTSIVQKVMAPINVVMKGEFSLLGLGDIVIPGFFVSILLRFDAVNAGIKGLNGEHASFAKPYFHWNIIFYALGLVATLYVMHAFKAAQPALLYLVPACLGASFIVAFFIERNYKKLVEYNEENDGEEDDKYTEKKSVENKKKQ